VSLQASGSASARRRRGARAGIALPRRRAITIIAVVAAAALVGVATVGLSLALFTAQAQAPAIFATKAVFPGERVTPAFQIGDSSAGSQTDTSSPFAFPADGLTTTTSAWSVAYAANRYLEFDFNDSLASGVAVAAASFEFRFASGGAGQACFYFEMRQISTGAVLAIHGGPGSPIGCVTGPTAATFSTPMPSVATSSDANDLRIRIFGKESTNGAMVVDLATVDGSTPHQGFTLYAVTFRDAADTTPETIPWKLQAP
jgi:hypothetical protein